MWIWSGTRLPLGLYSNLITSGVLLDQARVDALAEAGLDHVQISFQDADDVNGDRVAGMAGAQKKKREVAAIVRRAGLPLTVNLVVHRQNLDSLGAMLDMAVGLGAARIEVAHVQYYGWALANRDALLPSRAQLDKATEEVEAARERLAGAVVIDYVVPDYYARLPKSCMGGWGRRFITVTPMGSVLPCHAAESLPDFAFPSVRNESLADIWQASDAFNRFRGTDWMPAPLRRVRSPRNRLGRVSLPSLRPDRRCVGHRSRLRQVAASRASRCCSAGRADGSTPGPDLSSHRDRPGLIAGPSGCSICQGPCCAVPQHPTSCPLLFETFGNFLGTFAIRLSLSA